MRLAGWQPQPIHPSPLPDEQMEIDDAAAAYGSHHADRHHPRTERRNTGTEQGNQVESGASLPPATPRKPKAVRTAASAP